MEKFKIVKMVYSYLGDYDDIIYFRWDGEGQFSFVFPPRNACPIAESSPVAQKNRPRSKKSEVIDITPEEYILALEKALKLALVKK